MSEIDGSELATASLRPDWRVAVRVAGSESGDERVNSLPNAAIAFAKLRNGACREAAT
jgi:hypothetical protein